MSTTSASLLIRVKDGQDREAWERLVDLYTPLLFHWGSRQGLMHADAADLVQDVFIVLARELPSFEYDASRSFRSWLKTITERRAKNFHRNAAKRPTIGFESNVEGMAVVDSEADLSEEREHRTYITQRLLELICPEFREDVWKAFQMQTTEGRSAPEVAQELGISVNRVYIAKSRVLRRLRQEIEGLLD